MEGMGEGGVGQVKSGQRRQRVRNIGQTGNAQGSERVGEEHGSGEEAKG